MYLNSNSDFASDVRSQYLDSLRRGAGDMEAVQQLMADYGETLMDEEDAPAFWLALAEVQWEMGRLEETVKHNAFKCIEEELARIGTQSDAVASDRKLTNVLTALKRKLLSRQPPRKQIRPYRLYRMHTLLSRVRRRGIRDISFLLYMYIG